MPFTPPVSTVVTETRPRTVAETEAEAAEWEARFNAQIATLSPEERAEYDKLISDAYESYRAINASYRTLAQRVGANPKNNMSFTELRTQFWAAARVYANVTAEEFSTWSSEKMFAVLGVIANLVSQPPALPKPPPANKGGRPKGESFDGNQLKDLRGDRNKTVFSGLIGITPDTLTRIEATNRASKDSKRKIDRYKNNKMQKKVPKKPQ